MITVENIKTDFPKIKNLIRKEVANQYKDIDDIIDFYGEDAEIDEAVDLFIKLVNDDLDNASQKKVSKNKVKKVSNTKPDKEEKKSLKPQKKESNSVMVEKILPEISFIKRYAALNGKNVKEIKDKSLKLLASLQKAIIERVIQKNSPYAKEINDIQVSLIKLQKLSDGVIDIQNIEHYKEIASSQANMPCAMLFKSFIGIQGKSGVKDKAENLLKKIEKFSVAAPADYKYKSEISEITRSLKRYIAGTTSTIEISSTTLSGLYGLSGIKPCSCKSGNIVDSTDFLGTVFSPLNFNGKFKRLIGNPTAPFKIMMYGKPGSGKSTLALQFAKYLSQSVGQKVLYVAKEEGFSYTLQDKIKRMNAAHPNLSITDKMPSDLTKYDVIFIDSVNAMGYDCEELRKIGKHKSFVYVFQTTKEGKFRGSQEFEHDVDTTIIVEDMKAHTCKNRFGGSQEINVI